MRTTCDLDRGSSLDFEPWRALIRAYCGEYQAQRGDCDRFVGTVLCRSVAGLKAVDIGCNLDRVDRSLRDARRDGMDRYSLFFPTSGHATFIQNDTVARLSAGDVALIDL